jgi:hypothetical protein
MSISAMKYALDVLDNYVEDPRCEAHRATAVHFLEQAIAEAEKQEPVVGTKTWFEDGKMVTQHLYASDISQERVDETAKHGHEPVAWREVAGKTTHYYDYNEDGRGEPLYLHREWVGLTDQEIKDIREDLTYNDEDFDEFGFAKDIEAKLKEKNT